MKLIILLAFTTSAFTYQFDDVPSYVRIKNSVNARSAPNFVDPQYIINKQNGALPPGTEGEILENESLLTGNYGIKILITKSSKKEFIGKRVWVYHNAQESKNKQFLELYQDPIMTIPGSYKSKKSSASTCTNCHSFQQAMNARQSAPLLKAAGNIESYLNKPEKYETIKEMIEHYSSHPKVDKAISCALKKAEPKPTKYCYKYTKEALACGGLVSKDEKNSWHSDKHRFAASAENDLTERGFVNKLNYPEFKNSFTNISQAPKGAILIYRGPKSRVTGQHRYHIEMKTGFGSRSKYVSDFVSDNPVTGNPELTKSKEYELVAVMIKPPEKL